jgi:hypothetical protein
MGLKSRISLFGECLLLFLPFVASCVRDGKGDIICN